MFHKDTFRLIKNTFNRFMSLFMMVLIGVAFMMGLMSTKIVMKESVDVFNDENKLHDIQIYSSYGFDDDDKKALEDQDGIDEIFFSKMVDCYCEIPGGGTVVARVEELKRDVDCFNLIAGRMPKKENELVLLSASVSPTNYKLGGKLTFYLEDSDLSESLKETEYSVVGLAESPCYISKVLGTGTLDNKDLDIICYVPNDNFLADYYTTVYLTLEDSEDYVSYTKEYADFIASASEDLESFASVQQENRKAKILEDAQKEIDEGWATLEEEREKGQKELDDAKKKLDDANVQLLMADMQIQSGQATLDASAQTIRSSELLIEENEKTLNDAKAKVEEESGMSFDETYTTMEAAYRMYMALKTVKSSDIDINIPSSIGLGSLYDERDNIQSQIDANNDQIAEYNRQIDELDPSSPTYYNDRLRIESAIAILNVNNTNLTSDLVNIQNTIDSLESMGNIDYDETIDQVLDEIDEQAGGSIEDTYAQLTLLKNGIQELEEGKAKLEAGKKEFEAGQQQLWESKATIDNSKKEYEDGLKAYKDGLYEFNTEIEKAENELKKAEQDLAELPSASWMLLNRDSHYSSYMFKGSADQMGSIGVSLPVLFFLVAALVCMTTMTRLIDEQRGQIGIFRALGFSNNQIISKYVIYSLLASLSGGFIGIFVGMALFPTVIYNTWRLMYILPPMKMVIRPGILLICMFSFSLLMSGVSIIVTRKTLKEMPSQLMRPKAPKNAKPVFLEKIGFIWKGLSFTSKITARNLIRYKSRFFMTVIGVAGCASLLVVGWGVKDSISDIINVQYGKIFAYEYMVNIQDDKNLDEFMTALEDDYDNEYVVPYMQYMSKLYGGKNDDQTMYVQVMDARESSYVMGFTDIKGKKDFNLSNNGVYVSEKFADTNNIKKGDTITIESKAGIKADVYVKDICRMYFQHYIFMSDAYYSKVFGENVHPTAIAVIREEEAGLADSVKDIEGYVSVVNFNSMKASFQNMLEALNFIILVIIITAGALALVVLINLTQVNISERMREIATLKVLGFREKEVNSYLFKEIMILSVIGGIFGMPLGVVEHHFIMNIIDMDMVKFGNNIRLLSFSYAFCVTILFTILVLYFTKKPLRNIQMVESLKSVE